MKPSKYNMSTQISDNEYSFFNVRTREITLLNAVEYEEYNNIIANLNQNEFTLKESMIIEEMFEKGYILLDDYDELKRIQYIEKYIYNREDMAHIIVKPTMSCNFRCVYCAQNYENEALTRDAKEGVLKLSERLLSEGKKIFFTWYGGEPLLAEKDILDIVSKVNAFAVKHKGQVYYSIVTNGYNLNEELAKKFFHLGINNYQITIDGDKEFHDKARPLKNGKGSFDIVFKNIMNILECNKNSKNILRLRVNINDDNYQGIIPLLKRIPTQFRPNIVLDLINWFQTKEKISFFELYSEAISLGYRFANQKNRFAVCEAAYKNVYSILPTGKVAFCSQEFEKELCYGSIDHEGSVLIENEELLNAFSDIDIRTHDACKECIRLPLCMSGCKKARLLDKNYCVGNGASGLTLEQLVKLWVKDMKLNAI